MIAVMKTNIKIFSFSVLAVAASALLPSCAMESPFEGRGEGSLSINTEIRGDVNVVTRRSTRAAAPTQEALRENCVVYIENSRGVIRKYKGLDNIPSSIQLNTGSYVAEAWAGDSVSASFSQKFYRAYQPFEVAEGANTLTLHCNIANVLASITPESLSAGLSDLQVEFSHSRGSLTFTKDNVSEKGYFMMPSADKDLNYKVTGVKDDGSQFATEGKIENVKRAHEYRLNVTSEQGSVHEGGALIRIRILEVPVIDETVEIFPAPTPRGMDFDISKQVVKGADGFQDIRVLLIGYDGMSSILWNPSANFADFQPGMNILNKDTQTSLEALGINVEVIHGQDAAPSLDEGSVEVDEVYVTFSKAFLDALPESSEEYALEFESTNGFHKTGYGTLRIANTEDAVEHLAPVTTQAAPDPAREPMAVLAHSAVLTASLHDASVTGFGIRYREQGASAWTEAYPSSAQSSAARHNVRTSEPMKAPSASYSVKLTGLKAGTTYEYRAFCPGCEDAAINTFTTESLYQIPNASMEEWDTYKSNNKDIVFAGTGACTFWDSGNQGSASVGMTISNKSEDMKHSGQYSAKLTSVDAMPLIGILAAGNIFTGKFVAVDGTNGVLEFGREYNGSHPSKLRVYANYRPGNVDIFKTANEDRLGTLTKGAPDHGQIYVAFTDEPIEIRTKNAAKLFSTDDPHVLAYGQVTWTGNFGPDGQLQMVEIPIEYFDRAATTRATHIVIVACASKYGDFFSGSSSSVMYLDDFELVYD